MNEFVMLSPEKLHEIVANAVHAGVKTALSNMNSEPGGMMSDIQAAEYLGVSKNTMRHWRCKKRGPAYVKNGRAARYSRKDLDAWMAKNRNLTIDSLEDRHEKCC